MRFFCRTTSREDRPPASEAAGRIVDRRTFALSVLILVVTSFVRQLSNLHWRRSL